MDGNWQLTTVNLQVTAEEVPIVVVNLPVVSWQLPLVRHLNHNSEASTFNRQANDMTLPGAAID
jgi:hypothetical protein